MNTTSEAKWAKGITQKRPTWIAVDQYNNCILLKNTLFPRKALLDYLCATHCEKMYVETQGGADHHRGYVVGNRWYTLYKLAILNNPA